MSPPTVPAPSDSAAYAPDLQGASPRKRGRRTTNPPPAHSRPAAGASPAPAGGVVTRLRSRQLGPEETAGGAGDEEEAVDPQAPVQKKKKKTIGTKRRVQVTDDAGGSGSGSAAAKGKSSAVATGEASPPPRGQRVILPPYPNNGTSVDVLRWCMEMGRIAKLPAPPRPCTIRMEPKDSRTAKEVVSTADKIAVRKAARSVVSVLSSMPDGEGVALCSGIVVHWNETTKSATIVTSSAVACGCGGGKLLDPKPELLVYLPNKATTEGRLVFFNAHYSIALLEVLADSPLQPAVFGSSPTFGQEVFALARNDKSTLIARHGTVLWQEPPSFFEYRYWLPLSCKIALCGTGGTVIDKNGDTVGMAFGRSPNADMLSIPILQTSIEMWNKFSRIARPELGMDLRAFELLDASHQEEIELEHNISDGFIVKMVSRDSTGERLGIFEGDVIVSYNGHQDFTLHKFEQFLLSLGWNYLASGDASWTVDLELEVYDVVRHIIKPITFPLGFCDASELVYVFP